MAVELTAWGLGPLVSRASRLGARSLQPGRLREDPAAEILMRADLIQRLLELVREAGGFPIDRAHIVAEQAWTPADGQWRPVIVWSGSILYAE